jgi:hypothetical protein
MRHAAETELGHKLSSSIADSARAQEVATALVQKFDGDAAEKMAFIRDFSRKKNTAGTLDTLETVTKNGLPAEVTERARRGDIKASKVAPVESCNSCGHFMSANGGHVCEMNSVQAFLEVDGLSEDELSNIIMDKTVNPGVLRHLALTLNEDVLSAAAENPLTPIEVLETLATHKNKDVQSCVAGNLSTPLSVLEILSVDPDGFVRYSVGRNPKTPAAVLETFALGTDWELRQAVAGNPSAPPKVLTTLGEDDNERVRCAVAWNLSTPIETLYILSHDNDEMVLSGIRHNPYTPVENLDAKVKSAVAEGLAECVYMENDNAVSNYGVLTLLHNVNVSPGLLLEYAVHENEHLRKHAAQNWSMPIEMLVQLALDEDEVVVEAVAGNPSTPIKTLVALTKNIYGEVSRLAELNLAARY